MARKKKRRAHRKNPKRSHKRRRTHKRAHARARKANPKKVRRSSKRRSRKTNPKRHFGGKRRSHAKRPHKRRRRRNPAGAKMKGWQQAALGVALGAVGFAIANVGGYYVTKQIDPSFSSTRRNTWIASLLLGAAGLYLVKKGHVSAGIGLGAGALAAGPGIWATTQVSMLAAKASDTMSAVFGQNMSGYKRMNAVYGQNMAGYQRMNGYVPRQLPIAAVYGQNMSGMGDFAPAAPWKSPHPF